MTLRTDTCGDDSGNDAIGIYIDAIGIYIEWSEILLEYSSEKS